MSILRQARPESNYYVLSKSISENMSLSWAARGLLIFLLGKPDNWEVSVSYLKKQTDQARIKTGRDAIYALLKELEDAGYVKRHAQTRDDQGRMSKAHYTVCELQQSHTSDPNTPEPSTPNPYSVCPTLISNDLEQELTETKTDEKKKIAPKALTFSQWLDSLEGQDAITSEDPIFEYARKIGLPHEFLALAWRKFESEHLGDSETRSKRKQLDWRAVFRKSVRDAWYGLWWRSNDGEYALTTKGKQLQIEVSA